MKSMYGNPLCVYTLMKQQKKKKKKDKDMEI